MDEEPEPLPVLPASVRDRVAALASASLSGLPAAQVPAGLRPFPSDREVVDGVQRQGPRAVPSTALLRLPGRWTGSVRPPP